jgi:hypothetical protein
MESWPQQGKPPPGMWDTWRVHLMKYFLQQGRRLKTNLGVWKEWDPLWPRYFSPKDNSLFKFDHGKWTSFGIVQDRQARPIFSTQGAASTKPLLLHRATVIQTDKILMLTGHGHIRNKRCASCGSFKEYLKSQKADLWCFSNVNLQDDGFILSQAIWNQDAIAISNGSYKETFGMAAIILEGTTASGRIEFSVIVPGEGSPIFIQNRITWNLFHPYHGKSPLPILWHRGGLY